MAKNPAAVVHVIANCKRLIADAELLLERGSPGSSMALAILAFEEGGKGHYHELSFEKTKRTPSWHQFRQVIAAFVLFASLYQKYGLQAPELTDRMRELMEERSRDVKTLSDFAAKPIPDEYRQLARAALLPSISSLSGDAMIIAQVEFRWVGKIMKAAALGRIEALRQRGMYVDIGADSVTSDPADVTGQEAYYWIAVAKRLLLLLEKGDFKAPYGELAPTLEAMPKPLPKGPALVKVLAELQARLAEAMTERDQAAT